MLLLSSSLAAPHALRGDDAWVPHAVATGVAGGAWIASELGKDALAPTDCRWCEPPPFDLAIRDAARWDDPEAAGSVSNVLGFVVVPVGALGAQALLGATDGAHGELPRDVVYTTEAIAFAALANQAVKFSVGRERPFVWALDPGDVTADPADDNLSFYSGHTTLAFSAVAAATTVASLRGYHHAWVIAAVGGPLAGTVGYLRMGADKHWFSDVLVGAFVGTGAGVLVPLALHPRADGPVSWRVSVVPSPRPVARLDLVF